jgi:phage tail-like protein
MGTGTAPLELPSRYPIGGLLPALYADDDFAQRFTTGLDTMIAPAVSTLDNLAAYFDSRLAPADFLMWLASWVGAELDPGWPLELRRAVVARTLELHRWRGTARGLVRRLWLSLGVQARVSDGGGVTWSRQPGSEPPDSPGTRVRVQVWSGRSAAVDPAAVAAVVTASCPVHVIAEVEVLPGPPEA